jgi:hypothetical protein
MGMDWKWKGMEWKGWRRGWRGKFESTLFLPSRFSSKSRAVAAGWLYLTAPLDLYVEARNHSYSVATVSVESAQIPPHPHLIPCSAQSSEMRSQR